MALSDARIHAGITNETFSGLEGFLPASKAEVRINDANSQAEIAALEIEHARLQADNAGLSIDVADLQAENKEDQALLNTIIAQVNNLTPVSIHTVLPKMLVRSSRLSVRALAFSPLDV